MSAAARRPFMRAVVAALLLAPALLIIAAGFAAPLIRLAILSVSSPAGPLAAYRELVTVDVYRIVLRNTVVLALVVSAVSLVIGFVLAIALMRLQAGWRATILACIVLPLWISVLVRTFSWMLILERNGPLNRFLMALGITDQPLAVALRFSGRGDRHGACAAALCGAADLCRDHSYRSCPPTGKRWTRRATPNDLSARAAAVVGARARDGRDLHLPPVARFLRDARSARWPFEYDDPDTDQLIRQRAPRLATGRRGVDDAACHGARRGRPGAALRTRQRLGGSGVTQAGAWTKVFAALLAALVVIPVLAVVPLAFSQQSFVRLPPQSWSLRWWNTFFADPSWLRALLTSLEVAALSCLLSVAAGTSAALGLTRLRPRLRAFADALFLGPMVAPVIVLAVGLYALARAVGLVGSTLGMVLAHTMLALPYVILNVGVSIAALDPRLALAASGLGASPWRVFRTVTLPGILPGMLGGGIFAFVTSFDEVVLAVFLAGPSFKTLPVRIWEEVRVEYTPIVAVAATIMLVLALLGSLVGRLAAPRAA